MNDSINFAFTPQGMRRVMVKFSGLTVRGIQYRGQAWFEVTWPRLPVLELCSVCGMSAYRDDGSVIPRDATPAARAALEAMVRAEATEWSARNKPAFNAAEICRLEQAMDDAADVERKAQAALEAAQSAHADARLALESFKKFVK